MLCSRCRCCGLSHSAARNGLWRGMHRRGQLSGVDVPPGALVVADEVAAAGGAIDAGLLDAGRRVALVAQRAGGHQQAPAGARDHLVRRRQVLERVVDDRAHALGDRLVLQVDAVDAAVDRVARCASRSMPQSLSRSAAMRQRPSQSVVLGSSLLPRPVPPIGVPSLKAGCGSDMRRHARASTR